ncbi:MAG: choice-of-anchor tandem repeat GloVer-containing protein [Candidatus Sulfotelmatobacter sp.]
MDGFLVRLRVFVLFALATAIASRAQTFTNLANFDETNGNNPGYGSLVEGIDGNLYGTTINGGTSSNCTSQDGCGTVFKVTPEGVLTTLYSFCGETGCSDGENPYGGLVLATNGNFYGTTTCGGSAEGCSDGNGTVFEITPAGKLTTLFTFTTSDGAYPHGAAPTAALIQASNGNLYGTTTFGGSNGGGTIFEITPAGKLTTLYTFCVTCAQVPDGPYGGLVQATNGNFYGTTTGEYDGTIYKITPAGVLTTLLFFGESSGGPAGSTPVAAMIQAADGNLYGTTSGYAGTIFEITPSGALTTPHTFCGQTNCPDGSAPYGSLIQATDGNFYGTTYSGGAGSHCTTYPGCGTIFEFTPGGQLTTLHSFVNDAGGELPLAGLVQATDGNFYGTTEYGCCSYGTIFTLSMGFQPFVRMLHTSGKVGSKVMIFGTKLAGATSVKFNGTAATFTVVSASEIRATVPAGATTGKIQVATPSGVLKSNLSFRVSK